MVRQAWEVDLIFLPALQQVARDAKARQMWRQSQNAGKSGLSEVLSGTELHLLRLEGISCSRLHRGWA